MIRKFKAIRQIKEIYSSNSGKNHKEPGTELIIH